VASICKKIISKSLASGMLAEMDSSSTLLKTPSHISDFRESKEQTLWKMKNIKK
jgi:hypothetical protein